MSVIDVKFVIAFLLLLFIPCLVSSQEDNTYKIEVGATAISFWDKGNRSYVDRIKQTFESDIVGPNLFINQLTMSVVVSSNNKYGRLGYRFAQGNPDIRYSFTHINLSYGMIRRNILKVLDVSLEAGVFYSQLTNGNTFSFSREIGATASIGIGIPIYKGLSIENLFSVNFFAQTSVALITHTMSIGYTF